MLEIKFRHHPEVSASVLPDLGKELQAGTDLNLLGRALVTKGLRGVLRVGMNPLFVYLKYGSWMENKLDLPILLS